MPRFNPIRGIATVPSTSKVATPTPTAADAEPDVPLQVTIKQTIHTKRQVPIWIAQVTPRVDRKTFRRLLDVAKAGNGYWSSFGPVEIHGFIFFEETRAHAFAQLISPANATTATARSAEHCSASEVPAAQRIPCPIPEPVAEPVAIKLPPPPASPANWRQRLTQVRSAE